MPDDNDESSSGSVRAPSPPSRFKARPSRAWIKVPRPPPPAPVPLGTQSLEHQINRYDLDARLPPPVGPRRGDEPERPRQELCLSGPSERRAPLKPVMRVPRAARSALAYPPPPLASTSKLPDEQKSAVEASTPANQYKTPARRLLGPVPGGAWALETLTKLAAEREPADSGQHDEEDQLADNSDSAAEDLDALPPSIQLAYATFIPRTASKMLRRASSKKSQNKMVLTPRTRASKAVVEESPPPPTHRFAGSEAVNRLSSNAKTRYLRRTATGQRHQLSVEPESPDASGTHQGVAGQHESSDDLYAPGPVPPAQAQVRGRKRTRKVVDTPIARSVKRLRVGAPARGAFLGQVGQTGFLPLLRAKTPETAPSRLRSLSVLEKSIDRTAVKSRPGVVSHSNEPRRLKSLVFCSPEKADAVGAIPAESPDLGRHFRAAVMPEAAVTKQKPPRASHLRTPKQRMRILPARLPRPVRLVDLVNARVAKAAAAGRTDMQLEKADSTTISARTARRKASFRFATGPGAKRAPTVMYNLPTASADPSEDPPRSLSGESPIGSWATSSTSEGRAARTTTDFALTAKRDVQAEGQALETPARRALRRLSVMPTFRLEPDATFTSAAAPVVCQGPPSEPPEVRAGEPESPHLLCAASPSRPALDASFTPRDNLKIAFASFGSSRTSALCSVVAQSQAPPPSGDRVKAWLTTTRHKEEEQPVLRLRQRSRTTSSTSSGIWSRLPSQFDHRFDEPARDTPTPQESEQDVDPWTASLEAAAAEDAAGASLQRQYDGEMHIPDSQLDLSAEVYAASFAANQEGVHDA
ncbi:hypothetical protein JCM3774_005597 [Rhodotorula dairenensis]